MTINDKTGFFPSPAVHALSILDACDGDLNEACVIAVINAEAQSGCQELRYWLEVCRALEVKRERYDS